MRKGFLIYEEMLKYLVIFEETLHPITFNFLIYEEDFIFFFISVTLSLYRELRKLLYSIKTLIS
jgi:hypothetical protein